MADSKLSALAALTGANVADGDLFYVDDVSVTTSKSITAAELRIAMMGTALTNSLGGDVALDNTSNFFTGPTVAQGTSGTWWATGSVMLTDTAGGANFVIKLWDGTTVIDSATMNTASAIVQRVTLAGKLTTPAGNIRISVKDTTATTGKIIFNGSGESKDSTLTVFRIG